MGFHLRIYLHDLKCPEYELIILGNCLSVEKYFAVAQTKTCMHIKLHIHLNMNSSLCVLQLLRISFKKWSCCGGLSKCVSLQTKCVDPMWWSLQNYPLRTICVINDWISIYAFS